jgi:dTDP-glucose 4,6-dehydratase
VRAERILVTGGCGFIGSALVRRLTAQGRTVLNLDALTYAASPEAVASCAAGPGYAFLKADIADVAAVSEALAKHRPDAIAHLAAETHVDRSIDAPEAFIRTNVAGVERLLAATLGYWRGLAEDARSRFRFVHVSTDEVFGALGADDPPFTEDHPYAPRSPYAASKAGGDHLVRAFRTTYGLPTLVTHGSNTYGPWQLPEKLVPLTIARMAAGEPSPLYGVGAQRRDWLHVDDHAAAIERAVDLGAPGERYLVGGGEDRANREVVEAIADLLDARLGPLPDGASRRSLITLVGDRPGHDFRYALDTARTEAALDWRPRTRFAAGLAGTVDWFLEASDWRDRAVARAGGPVRLGAGAA